MAVLLLSALLAASAPAPRAVDPDYWPSSGSNPYQADPVVARRLRCAALMEAVGTVYFSPVGFHPDPAERRRLDEVSPDTPRMPEQDVRERRDYAQAFLALYDAAEAAARGMGAYGARDFYGWYGDDNKKHALAKVRAGVGLAALGSPRVRCFEYPQVAALEVRLRARLALPVPGSVLPVSPRIRPNWLPVRSAGYLYRDDTYRFLACAGVAQAIAKARFGPMPPPGQADHGMPRDPPPERAVFREAIRRTYAAGLALLAPDTAAERLSYEVSFYHAQSAGETLARNGVAAEALREPPLGCAGIAAMQPVMEITG